MASVTPNRNVGERAGRYRIVRQLGAGGMGTVFEAHDASSGRTVALKRMHEDLARDEVQRLRFEREFHTLASLRHPGIVQAYEYGVDEDGPFYTMELLGGTDLRDEGPMPWESACRVLRDVASALSFLHGRRLLHRDVTPRNVRLTADGRAKLIDFGALATVGISDDIAGTPPFVPPEAVRGLPLDHRADLFGLGALAYWLLTGRHAYPARGFEELLEVWSERPSPPSALAPDVPSALDQLVLSMLGHESLARPASAVEIIDRLGGIASLPSLAEAEPVRGHLASAACVGRERELERIRRLVDRASEGRGGALCIEAPSGTGKSRLLREAGLLGQLAGAVVVHVDAGRAAGAYGLARELVEALVHECRDDALEAARPHASLLAHAVPVLGEQLGRVEPPELSGDPADDRMRVQQALTAWLRDLGTRRSVLLCVDDVQRADDASAAVLAALVRDGGIGHLTLVAALRTDEEPRAPGALAALRGAAERLRLRGLSREATAELVRTLFGELPQAGELASWMHEAAGGSPLHCTELAHHLVDRGAVRWADGAWTLAEAPSSLEPPRGLREAMDLRVGSLPAAARELAGALAVVGRRFALPTCVAVADAAAAPEPDRDAVFEALDVLVREEVLVGAEDRFAFRHDGLREAMLRDLSDERRRALELRAARALAPGDEVPTELEAQVGWHLLRGGEEQRGAELLERAGRRLYESQSLGDSVPLLEAALEVYERRGLPPEPRIELRRMLVMAGIICHYGTSVRHVHHGIDQVWPYAGFDVAERLGPWVGRTLGFVLGVTWAAARRLLTPPDRRGPKPTDALTVAVVMCTIGCTLFSHRFELDELDELVGRMGVFTFARGRIPYAAWLLCMALLDIPLNRRQTMWRRCEQAERILERDRVTPMSELERLSAEAAAYNFRAFQAAFDQDPRYEPFARHVEGLDIQSFAVGAKCARVFYHRGRGEEPLAADYVAEVGRIELQLGDSWLWKGLLSWGSSLGYAQTRDVLGLRRTIAEMEHLREMGYHMDDLLDLAKGEYHRERGDVARSLELLEPLCERGPLPIVAQQLLAALAETLLAAGKPERAADV
ncbi:MAG: protein kinase domain-containing protein, partial [Polyangiales bacterium]